MENKEHRKLVFCFTFMTSYVRCVLSGCYPPLLLCVGVSYLLCDECFIAHPDYMSARREGHTRAH